MYMAPKETCYVAICRENATEDRVEAMVEENVDALGADTTHQQEVGGTEVEPEEEEDLQQAKHGQSDKSGVDQPPTSTPSPPTPNAANSRAKLQGIYYEVIFIISPCPEQQSWIFEHWFANYWVCFHENDTLTIFKSCLAGL